MYFDNGKVISLVITLRCDPLVLGWLNNFSKEPRNLCTANASGISAVAARDQNKMCIFDLGHFFRSDEILGGFFFVQGCI